ncbi:MAG TPA: DsrE family protein [Dissulfurispiraceae bacterium]|nr:DsrE family protein [Dissulfurispiraceae bacterium]
METVSILLRRPPYGSTDAAEAVRHALGGVTNDFVVNLVLVDGGIHAARKQQDVSSTVYSSIGSEIADCIDMGVSVYVDGASAAAMKLPSADIIDGVVIESPEKLAEVLRNSDTVMIF